MVSERLGHADVAFTLQVYGHVLPGHQREAAEAASGLVDHEPENVVGQSYSDDEETDVTSNE